MEVYAKMTNNDPHGHENIRPQSSGGTTERSVRSVSAGAERGRGTGRNTVNSRKSVVRRGAGGRRSAGSTGAASSSGSSGGRRRGTDWKQELRGSFKIIGRVALKVLTYVVNVFLTLLLIGIIAGTIMGCAFLYYINNYVDGSVDDFDMYMSDQDASTSIYTMDWTDRQSGIGTEVEIEDQRLYAKENRLLVSYDKVPKYLVDAYVATEDHRFWNHPGVDWIRTIRAALNYFLGNSFGGASTITQQVVKNITQDDDVTIQRKVQEILRALNLEKVKDKTEIMELYLNLVYCSRGCYGVQSAAYVYFGKDVSELTLLESVESPELLRLPQNTIPCQIPKTIK